MVHVGQSCHFYTGYTWESKGQSTKGQSTWFCVMFNTYGTVYGCGQQWKCSTDMYSPPTDPGLIHTNLAQLLDSVDWGWDNTFGFHFYLNIPGTKYDDIKRQYSDVSEIKMALCRWYLNNHPAPSWKHVGNALYEYGDCIILDVLQSQYLKGEFIIPFLKVNLEVLVESFLASCTWKLHGRVWKKSVGRNK